LLSTKAEKRMMNIVGLDRDVLSMRLDEDVPSRVDQKDDENQQANCAGAEGSTLSDIWR